MTGLRTGPGRQDAEGAPAGPGPDRRFGPVASGTHAGHRMTLVLDPRFPGGTCSAVAAEIDALGGLVDLSVVALETAMFLGRRVNRTLQEALDRQGLDLVWNPPVIRADTVVFHNPACLKFDTGPGPRISCRSAIVVTHENPLRPGGGEGFDMAGCLARIDRALTCGTRRLAPVSPHNRRSVAAWLSEHGSDWVLADFDWFNICNLDTVPPSETPRDRRGRHSRPGLEKFPPLEVLLAHFPPHAELCSILGGDSLLTDPETLPAHWKVHRFGEMEVTRFLAGIDFFVYFTNPMWRESFGRVILEAIAAGKLVITDPGTAETFGDAVVASRGDDVDAIVAAFVADPARYVSRVHAAQSALDRFRPDAFTAAVLPRITQLPAPDHALL